MTGNNYLKEHAQKQIEQMDTDGKKLLNNTLMVDVEEIEWSMNGEPKFPRKKNTKSTRVALIQSSKGTPTMIAA